MPKKKAVVSSSDKDTEQITNESDTTTQSVSEEGQSTSASESAPKKRKVSHKTSEPAPPRPARRKKVTTSVEAEPESPPKKRRSTKKKSAEAEEAIEASSEPATKPKRSSRKTAAKATDTTLESPSPDEVSQSSEMPEPPKPTRRRKKSEVVASASDSEEATTVDAPESNTEQPSKSSKASKATSATGKTTKTARAAKTETTTTKATKATKATSSKRSKKVADNSDLVDNGISQSESTSQDASRKTAKASASKKTTTKKASSSRKTTTTSKRPSRKKAETSIEPTEVSEPNELTESGVPSKAFQPAPTASTDVPTEVPAAEEIQPDQPAKGKVKSETNRATSSKATEADTAEIAAESAEIVPTDSDQSLDTATETTEASQASGLSSPSTKQPEQLAAEAEFYDNIRQQVAVDRQAKRRQIEEQLEQQKSHSELAENDADGSSGTQQSARSPEEHLVFEKLDKMGRPVHVRDLEKNFTRSALDRLGGWRGLEMLLERLVLTGDIVRTRKKTYGLTSAMNLIRGRFQATASGFGFVIPDSGGADYFVPENSTLEAWSGDIVLARREGRERGGFNSRRQQRGDGNNTRASVVRIVKRAYKQLVGSLGFFYGHPVLKPDDHRVRQVIHMHPEGLEELDAGARVVAELFWPEQTGEDEVFGHLLRVLGNEDDPETETEAVIVKYNLRGEFPAEVLAQAEATPATIRPEELEGRLDLREYNIFTVDGSDAKDFDDAIHIRPTNSGSFEVGIHIADVSHYVVEGTPLDLEAYERATSVYLPGMVLPMLPEHLSNGVCSLVPDQDRLTMSTLIELNGDGEVLGAQVVPSVIHSKARLTYDEVQDYSEAKAALPEHARALEGDMHLLLKMTSKLRQRRLSQGSLDFKLREVKVDVGKNGRMQLIPISQETARGMIEDLMLLSNKAVAKFLLAHQIPSLFRVHEEPTLQRFQETTSALARMGLSFADKHPTPQAYQAMLRKVRGSHRESTVNTLLLRSMQQARYANENLGHFGLAFAEYLHFTSPIRRYPDLVVHRHVKAVLAGTLTAGSQQISQLNAQLPEMAQHTSDKERSAAEAERDLVKYYQCKWAEEHLAESFEGNVSGVVSSGLFVALDNGVEGKVHISHLDDDYYFYIEEAQMLKGRSKSRSYRLGDRIEITISESKPLARHIEFVLADPNDPEYLRGSYASEDESETYMINEGNPEVSNDNALADSADNRDSRVRARRREDRERERQEKLRDLPLNVPKFTLEEEKKSSGANNDNSGNPKSSRSGGRHNRGRNNDRSRHDNRGHSNSRRSAGRGFGRARIVTVARSRNEHLRPVNMTVQRMYFGDWSNDKTGDQGNQSGNGESERRPRYSRSQAGHQGRKNASNGTTPAPHNGASASHRRNSRNNNEEEGRRRQRRRRRSNNRGEGAAE